MSSCNWFHKLLTAIVTCCDVKIVVTVAMVLKCHLFSIVLYIKATTFMSSFNRYLKNGSTKFSFNTAGAQTVIEAISTVVQNQSRKLCCDFHLRGKLKNKHVLYVSRLRGTFRIFEGCIFLPLETAKKILSSDWSFSNDQLMRLINGHWGWGIFLHWPFEFRSSNVERHINGFVFKFCRFVFNTAKFYVF